MVATHTIKTRKFTQTTGSSGLGQAALVQGKCACGGTLGSSGVCEACRKKRQTKFLVNEPGDIYEQEADRVADQMMTVSAQHTVRNVLPHIHRFSGKPAGQLDATPASVDQLLANSGTPLDPALRQDMEQRFGHDFSGVRVHVDGAADQSAQALNARAYTLGDHVVFGAGHYAPEASDGRRLLAHELTHVVQQQRQPAPWIQRAPPVSDPPAATDVASGNRYNLELLLPKQYLQDARTYNYPNQTKSEAIDVLFKFRERLMDVIDIHRALHRELRDNREEHSTVGFWADTFGGVSLPDYEMWETPKGTLFEVRLLLDALRRGLKNPETARKYFIEQTIAGTWRGGFDPGADPLTQVTSFLQVAANQIGECVASLVKYKEGTERGAETGVTVCKVSIVVLSSAVGGEAFTMARAAGYGLVGSSLAASGAGVITTEASEIGGQIGEMRYGDRKWGDFDYERIAKVGAKSAVTGFIGAVVGGKLSELAGAGFAKFAGPLMKRLGFNLNAAGMKWLGGLGQTWLVSAGSAPFTTAANVAIDKAMGDKTVDNWGDFFNLVLQDMKTSVELGTFLHVAGATIKQKGGTAEPPPARPAGGNGSGEGGGGTSGGGGGGGRGITEPVDPYARTEEMPAQTPKVKRGNAPIASARTLRPGELEAQTSATQSHSTVGPPVDPHARTVEITPDTSGPQRGNAAPGNARTLTPEEVAREQADTSPMSAETPQAADATPPPIPAAEPPAPLAPGAIHDPVAASQALARASRNGTSFRLINDPELVRISWEGEGHPGEAPPPAWVDGAGKLTVDTTRIRVPLRSSDVLAGPIYEAPAAAEPTPSGQTQESIRPERTSAADARESAMPPPIGVRSWAPPEVTESIRDPQAAQALYWQQHSEFMRGETEDPAVFTIDRAIYDANWKLARGKGDSPPAWRDQYGRLNVDATRVDIHQPPTEQTPSSPSEGATAGPVTKPLNVVPAPRAQGGTAKMASPQKAEVIDSSISGEMYRVHDSANSKFYAQGRLGSHGELEIDLRTEVPAGEKSAALKGREQFRNIVNFFGGGFSAIKGTWQFGTNLNKVNELTARGMTLQEAAGRTWTAGQASDLGFTRVPGTVERRQPGELQRGQSVV